MPNGRTHRIAGATIGGVTAACYSREIGGAPLVAELLGGSIGGYLTSGLPDTIDPPTSPSHRGIGHSAALASLVAKFGKENLAGLQRLLRQEADGFHRLYTETEDTMLRAGYWFLRLGYHFVAGLLAGLIAGFLSHDALDLFSPAGLPILA